MDSWLFVFGLGRLGWRPPLSWVWRDNIFVLLCCRYFSPTSRSTNLLVSVPGAAASRALLGYRRGARHTEVRLHWEPMGWLRGVGSFSLPQCIFCFEMGAVFNVLSCVLYFGRIPSPWDLILGQVACLFLFAEPSRDSHVHEVWVLAYDKLPVVGYSCNTSTARVSSGCRALC